MEQQIQPAIDLHVSVDDANTILTGLAELPAKKSFELMTRIKREAESQLAPKQQDESAPQGGQQLLTEDK